MAQAGILVFCPQTHDKKNHLNARVFADIYGVPEDPATGSGNGCWAGYLSPYRYFGSDTIDIRVEQGYEIRRPHCFCSEHKPKSRKFMLKLAEK